MGDGWSHPFLAAYSIHKLPVGRLSLEPRSEYVGLSFPPLGAGLIYLAKMKLGMCTPAREVALEARGSSG